MVKDIATGAASGRAGGLVMSVATMTGTKARIVEEPLPHRVEHRVNETTPHQEMVLSQGGHILYAAGNEAPYAE